MHLVCKIPNTRTPNLRFYALLGEGSIQAHYLEKIFRVGADVAYVLVYYYI